MSQKSLYIYIYIIYTSSHPQNTVILTLSNLRNSHLTFATVSAPQSLTVRRNQSGPQPRFHQLVYVRFVQVFVAVHDYLKHNGCHMTQICSIDNALPRVCDSSLGHCIVSVVTRLCQRVGILFRTSRYASITYGKKVLHQSDVLRENICLLSRISTSTSTRILNPSFQNVIQNFILISAVFRKKFVLASNVLAFISLISKAPGSRHRVETKCSKVFYCFICLWQKNLDHLSKSTLYRRSADRFI
jgi:hypothetical protein